MSDSKSQKVAIIGSGISGIASAWFLSQTHQVTLFEKEARLGGHTNTVDFEHDGKKHAVDTGFIVYNEPNYPLLTAMFKYLHIHTAETDMSFAVSIDQGRLEYAGNNLNTLFAQRKNLFSLTHWKMIREILRFNKQAKKDLHHLDHDMSLGDYLTKHKFSSSMQQDYLLPMAAAIWSCPTETMLKFPVQSFLQFFNNHGLLNVNDRPQWKTVKNGARHYIDAIKKHATFDIIHQAAKEVKPKSSDQDQVVIYTADGKEHHFDQVIFACHGDQTYQLLNHHPDFGLMANFKFQPNQAWLHTDETLMPQIRSAWASWNYLSDLNQDQKRAVAVTYWMNQLQPLKTETPILVTLNPTREPDPTKVIAQFEYDHPVFDEGAMMAQKELEGIQGHLGCWFAGAYTGYGFHEDGLRSAARIARLWQLPLPWEHY
ncbi:NAD(P)/FAD-dependent oxidoreductase [Thiomicrospira cyclica]|uniref:FAD dependent oxidoreductase n=1 Tax=Thiomicrospira cyclica (strain DSM 14477 / JCM 11371 / ALM1) TaxID=717773 RepID=F6D9K6_THICA|nr:FAD-dependent oxidoreductase [Thiomicrospira cyclica]AEG30963.1 FAD dependent oxidoreductase [Thiomicrospira cyclica ALM1]